MPNIDDILKKSAKKPFKKTQYRVWDLDGRDKPEQKSVNQASKKTINAVEKEVITNQQQTNNKSKTNNKQSLNKPATNLEQSSNKPKTNTKQINNKTDNTNTPEISIDTIHALIGIQRKLFSFIVDMCVKRGELSTGPLRQEFLKNVAGTDDRSTKMSLVRLIRKGLIFRGLAKVGRGGFSNFSITSRIQSCALEARTIEKTYLEPSEITQPHRQQTDNEIDNAQIHSNSSNYNKTITNLDKEWESISIDGLADIGFTAKHLADIAETKLCEPKIVQESINHFAFGLDQGKYNYPDPLNVFIGCLRKGKPWFESNYQSPQERALKELLEHRKAEHERQKNLIQEFSALEFNNWYNKLKQEAIDDLLLDFKQPKTRMPDGIIKTMKQAHLKQYFMKEIWPTVMPEQLLVSGDETIT